MLRNLKPIGREDTGKLTKLKDLGLVKNNLFSAGILQGILYMKLNINFSLCLY